MKFVAIIFLTLLTSIQKCGQTGNLHDFQCEAFVHTLFNESFFYIPKPGQLNLTGIDTITILDGCGYLDLLNCPKEGEILVDTVLLNKGVDYGWTSDFDSLLRKVNRKIYQIKRVDDIPVRIRGFHAALHDQDNPKYRCYFTLNEVRINGDSLYVQMDKFITNHRIGATFVWRNDKWRLVDKLIGQY
jgi:hypothetical protein